MSTLRIRRAVPADATTLSALAQASKAHWGYPPELLELWRPQLTVTPDALERLQVWCAELPGGLAGFYALALEGGVAELEHLWVEPRSIGRGIGRALLEHALVIAAEAGATELRVVSDPHAEGFYLRMGATRTGTQDSTPPGRKLPVLSLPPTDVSQGE